MASSTFEFQDAPDWVLAKEGLKMFINNRSREAENMLEQHTDSLVIFSGYSYTLFLDALMNFEEEKVTKAITILKEVEKRCNNPGWLKYVKSRIFRSTEQSTTITESLETQIILADSQVCLAILVFLQQDISGYLKAGWVLRKAWKLYQNTYTDILNLYNSQIGPLNLPDPSMVSPNSENIINVEKEILTKDDNMESINRGYNFSLPLSYSQSLELDGKFQHSKFPHSSTPLKNRMKKSLTVNNSLGKQTGWSSKFTTFSLNYLTSTFNFFPKETMKATEAPLNKKVLIRLMNAVAFGYGLFQLGISLLPPSLLRLTSFFGLKGNRMHGLACLMYSRLGVDMRAPLATLSLLWYHCIVRPYYGLDGSNIGAGAQIADLVIKESRDEYGQSALFLFFKGRLCRIQGNIPEALKAFTSSVNNSSQNELKLLSLHEVGWCYLIQLDYMNAENIFSSLFSASRWARPFYSYITCICKGSTLGQLNYENLEEYIGNIRASARSNPLEHFLNERVSYLSDMRNCDEKCEKYWKLFVFELLYLWNALASCTHADLSTIIEDCETCSPNLEPMLGLSKLIQGTCSGILGQNANAISALQQCIECRTQNTSKHLHKDEHVLAFAQYELGSIFYKNLETKEEGKIFLKRTLEMKDYDFEETLSVRVTLLLKSEED